MNFYKFAKLGRTLPLSLTAAVAVFAAGAWAQDMALVPFLVSVDATVRAEPVGDAGEQAVELTVKANETDTLRLPLLKTTGVVYFGGRKDRRVFRQ
jgi:hypothetical protein